MPRLHLHTLASRASDAYWSLCAQRRHAEADALWQRWRAWSDKQVAMRDREWFITMLNG